MQALIATLALTLALAACSPSGGGSPGGSCAPNATTSAIYSYANSARRFFGIAPLAWNGQLACLAQGWSGFMASSGQLTHRNLGATLRSPAFAGWRTLGENILRAPSGYSAKQIHDTWMASTLHRNNILNRGFTRIGVGIAYGRGWAWVTEDFGA